MSSSDNPLHAVLQELFPDNADFHVFLGTPAAAGIREAILRDLPSVDVSKNRFLSAAVAQIEANGLATSVLFRALQEWRPQQHERIAMAERACADRRSRATSVHLPTKALLRALQPFDKGDILHGRDVEVQDIETIVTGEDFRFGVVLGRTGCGKTSLLRSGLQPRLEQREFTVIYLPRPTPLAETLQAALAGALLDDASRAAAGSSGNRPAIARNGLVVIADQFEEFFLQHPVREAIQALAALIADCMRSTSVRVRVLLGIRDDFFHNLLYFTPQIIDPTASAYSYKLEPSWWRHTTPA